MRLSFTNTLFPFFNRNKSGESFYDINSSSNWTLENFSNIEIAQNHPILTPALLFVSKLFSQANFYIIDKNTGEKVKKHWLLDLINQPNHYQTQNDFFESLQFGQIAQGQAVIYTKKTLGLDRPNTLYLLNPDLIKYPDGFKTKMYRASSDAINRIKIIYDEHGENLSIKIGDLLYMYDTPNCLGTEHFFDNGSRIDGLRQTLINTKDSLLAKNIILKTNGKELITGTDKGFPLGADEKTKIESLYQNNYGLGSARKRGIITKAGLNWQSLHIALRDLGLDESVKVDGNLIYTALHIPKDILSLEAKKTTYNNFKESMVSYIQNEMQSTLDATAAVFQKLIKEENLEIKGDYEHLPIMQFVLIERYEGIEKRGLALKSLRDAGLPDDVALDLCGFDKSIKLEKTMQSQQMEAQAQQAQQAQENNNSNEDNNNN